MVLNGLWPNKLSLNEKRTNQGINNTSILYSMHKKEKKKKVKKEENLS